MSSETKLKVLIFVGSSRNAIRRFPEAVRQNIGYALYEVQKGGSPASAKPLKGFGGAGVLEIIDDFDGNTYRAVYTVTFRDRVYVLHCFQKKSKRGIRTPKKDMDLIRRRLRIAEEDCKTKAK